MGKLKKLKIEIKLIVQLGLTLEKTTQIEA